MTTTDERLIDELQNFREIARYLSPSPGEVPRLEGVEIAGLSIPLRGVIGGDHLIYIDFGRRYDLGKRIEQAQREKRPDVAKKLSGLRHRAGILVADVSGHRMTDALIGAMLHQAFLVGAQYELDRHGEITTRIFEHINTRFHRTTAVNKFFTMIYGEISDRGTFRFVSAGHQPPAVFSREYGRFMKISADRLVSFPPVGTLPSSADPDGRIHPSIYGYKKRYEINELNLLAAGDILLLQTDGLAEHAEGTFFPEGLEALLADTAGQPLEDICGRIRDAMVAAAEPDDDVTFVLIRKTPR